MPDNNSNSELKTLIRLRYGPVENTSDYYDQLTGAELLYIADRLFQATGHTLSNRRLITRVLIQYVNHYHLEYLVEQMLHDYTSQQDLSIST